MTAGHVRDRIYGDCIDVASRRYEKVIQLLREADECAQDILLVWEVRDNDDTAVAEQLFRDGENSDEHNVERVQDLKIACEVVCDMYKNSDLKALRKIIGAGVR